MKTSAINIGYMSHFKFYVVLLTGIFNLLLAYCLLWNPYSLYFDRPELSTIPFGWREKYAVAIGVINLIILLVLTIIMVAQYRKARRLFICTPLASVLTLVLLLYVQTYYPDAESHYTKEDYQYLEQNWHSGGSHTFKRFKSDKPLRSYKDYRTIVWCMDSSGKTQTKM